LTTLLNQSSLEAVVPMRSPVYFITCYEQYSYYTDNNAFYQIHSLMFNMP